MTIICSQCGAVLPAEAEYCRFCDTSFSTEIASEAPRQGSSSKTRGNLALESMPDTAWRAELAQRMASYRARRRKLAPRDVQKELPFDRRAPADAPTHSVVVAEQVPTSPEPAQDDFAFTIAIGRMANSAVSHEESRMEIDVSLPQAAGSAEGAADAAHTPGFASGLFPVSSIAQRGVAALIDSVCLLFAYGGFLTLFGSLGGQFTLSKLSAAVYAATIALFYIQYFGLFTIFGGTTPGMMLRHLQVVSFSGDAPTPRQLLFRSAGYVLSAGSLLLGFVWAYWDEDSLTWHDRLSRTYLTSAAPVPHADAIDTLRRA